MAVATSRTLVVLQALSEEQEPLSVSQISQRTGVGRASLTRLLQLLVDEGAVATDCDTGKFTVGFWAWQVGIGAIAQNGVRAVAFPHMLELAGLITSTVNLAILDGHDAVFVESIVPVGGRLTSKLSMIRHKLLDNASGRVMAAYLADEERMELLDSPLPHFTGRAKGQAELREELELVALRGYATIDREQREDLSGIAVPLRNSRGRAIGALGLPCTGALEPQFVERVLPHGLAAAAAVSSEMGFRSAERLQLA